jgi:DNA-binding response OmpR family regulator
MSSSFNSERQSSKSLPLIRRDKIKEILLLDFNLEASRRITSLLESQGIKVTAATDFDKAYPLLTSNRFDFALLRWSLEDESWMNLGKLIRATNKRMTLFYYTDSTLEEEVKQAIAEEASSHSINHVDTHSLLKVIFLHLDLK